MMGEIAQGIWAGLAGASLLDRVNLALGIAGVVLMVRRSLWAFPVGLVAVTVQGVLFFGAKFYADAALQVFFFGALGWGWWNWTRANDRGDGGRVKELPVTRLASSGRVWVVILVVMATVIWALAARRWTGEPLAGRHLIASFGINQLDLKPLIHQHAACARGTRSTGRRHEDIGDLGLPKPIHEFPDAKPFGKRPG